MGRNLLEDVIRYRMSAAGWKLQPSKCDATESLAHVVAYENQVLIIVAPGRGHSRWDVSADLLNLVSSWPQAYMVKVNTPDSGAVSVEFYWEDVMG